MTYQTQHAKVVRLEVSVGSDDADRTIEDFERAIRSALKSSKVRAHNVTITGGYYIIDGRVCLPVDYDAVERDRRPGTHPPYWAGGPQPSATPPPAAVESTSQGVSIREIFPEGYRKPERNEFGRKVRSDKGVKRGPRARPEGLKESA